MTYESFTENIEKQGLSVELEGNDLLVTDQVNTLARISSVTSGDYKLMEFSNMPLIFLVTQITYTAINER